MATRPCWRMCRYALLGLVAASSTVYAAPHAHFELRLAPEYDDAVLALTDPTDLVLGLEVWGQVTGVPNGVRATAFSVFLDAFPGRVVSANADFVSPVFTFGCRAQAGADNQPESGDLGRACVDPIGTTAGIGAPALWGQFSVTAQAVGGMTYAFGEGGAVRVWRVTLSNGMTLQGNDVTGSVAPELSQIDVVADFVSPDADRDGDVDLADYAALIECVRSKGSPATGRCAALDLEPDGQIDRADLDLLILELTGPLSPGSSGEARPADSD